MVVHMECIHTYEHMDMKPLCTLACVYEHGHNTQGMHVYI